MLNEPSVKNTIPLPLEVKIEFRAKVETDVESGGLELRTSIDNGKVWTEWTDVAYEMGIMIGTE